MTANAPAHDAAAIAEIAKGLTLGERIFIRRIDEINAGGGWGVFKPTEDVVKRLRKKKVVEPDHQGGNLITPLGLAVRAHISQAKGE